MVGGTPVEGHPCHTKAALELRDCKAAGGQDGGDWVLFPLSPLQWGLLGSGGLWAKGRFGKNTWGQQQHCHNWTQEKKKQGESFLKEATSSWERAASRKGAELSLVMGVRKSRAGFKQFSTEENNECLILSPANSREFSFWIYNQSSVGYQGSSSFSAKSSSIYTKPSLRWGLFLMTPGLN